MSFYVETMTKKKTWRMVGGPYNSLNEYAALSYFLRQAYADDEVASIAGRGPDTRAVLNSGGVFRAVRGSA